MSREDIVARIPDGWYKGLDVGEGWDNIIIDLNARLASLDPDYTVAQVKEKFGGLRYYIDYINEDVRESAHLFIQEAEDVASVTCEVCGAQGELRDKQAWMRTLCDNCHANRKSLWS